MKKTLLLLIGLSGITISAMAQQKQTAIDSMLKTPGLKPDTSLFDKKLFSLQLPPGNNLKLNQLNSFTYPALANNTRQLTYNQLDNMPVLRTEGNSKMPTLKTFGQSNMPVAGKDTVKFKPLSRP